MLYSYFKERHRFGGHIGTFAGGEWSYYFHGMLHCDFEHIQDKRFVRMDFGPKGRLDTFMGFGVLQFVMTTRPPWREFSELREYLAEKPPPYGRLSGSHTRMFDLFDQLKSAAYVEGADPELAALVEAHTTTIPNGSRLISLPKDLPESVWWDHMVCRRYVISATGYQVLEQLGQPRDAASR
jgi:hypothetical protein